MATTANGDSAATSFSFRWSFSSNDVVEFQLGWQGFLQFCSEAKEYLNDLMLQIYRKALFAARTRNRTQEHKPKPLRIMMLQHRTWNGRQHRC